jgi:hypothetical protein
MQSLLIGKPRKHDKSTYSSNVYWETKNKFLTFEISNAVMCGFKRSGEDVYLFIKSKPHNNAFADLNSTVIDIVKANCEKWFSQALSPDLIEDYYSDTLVYDKRFGNLIRLKCLSANADDLIDGQVKCNVKVTLKSLRFFKQKFVLEWDLDEIEIQEQEVIANVEYDDSEDEEIPMPDDEDMVEIRKDVKARCVTRIKDLEVHLSSLLKQKEELELLVESLDTVRDYDEFLRTCERVDEVLMR